MDIEEYLDAVADFAQELADMQRIKIVIETNDDFIEEGIGLYIWLPFIGDENGK